MPFLSEDIDRFGYVRPKVIKRPRGIEWQPVKEELSVSSSGQSREMPPYIRRTKDDQLLVTVAEPVDRDQISNGRVEMATLPGVPGQRLAVEFCVRRILFDLGAPAGENLEFGLLGL